MSAGKVEWDGGASGGVVDSGSVTVKSPSANNSPMFKMPVSVIREGGDMPTVVSAPVPRFRSIQIKRSLRDSTMERAVRQMVERGKVRRKAPGKHRVPQQGRPGPSPAGGCGGVAPDVSSATLDVVVCTASPVTPPVDDDFDSLATVTAPPPAACAVYERDDAIRAGSTVAGRYLVVSEISRGGYGVVYRARQIGIDRVVAVKRLRTQNDQSVNRRFMQEADIIKNLVHPNTIRLIDAGMDGRHLFLVMEYVDGVSLKSLLANRRALDLPRVLHITKQILKSVNEAHRRGIIHRDLKPSNILIQNVIGERDFVKVLDFGIAKVVDNEAQRLTRDGKVMGTPQYLAPEAMFGEETGEAVDIYAIGLIMAEMLMGKPVMPADVAGIVRISTSKSPVPLPSWLEKSEIGAVIRRAIHKDPAMRYVSAEEMLADIAAVESGMRRRGASRVDVRPAFPQRRYIYGTMVLAVLLVAANAIVLSRFLI